ncbi:MAG: cobalamin-dependent protein [Halobacteriota archaeon]
MRQDFEPGFFTFKVVDRDVEREMEAFHPDVAAISATTPNYGRAATYAHIAKTYELPVLIGGVHISTLPSSLADDMDVGIVGEGERTIVDLFRLYEADGCFATDALAHTGYPPYSLIA